MERERLLDDPVSVLEPALRNILHDRLSAEFGPKWYENEDDCLGPDWAASLERKSQQDTSQRSALAFDIPLAFAEFSALPKLLKKHRVLFRGIFADLDTTAALLEKAVVLRNAIQHNRDISASQRALLAGIAGEVDDALVVWYTGARMAHVETELQFTRHVFTDGISSAQVLAEAKEAVDSLASSFERVATAECADLSRTTNDANDLYSIEFVGSNTKTRIHTAANPEPKGRIGARAVKYVSVTHTQRHGCPLSIDRVLKGLDMPYRWICYRLSGPLDIGRLEDICRARSGLAFSSAASAGDSRTNVEFSFLSGALRVGVGSPPGGAPGAIWASSEAGFREAHVYLPPRHLLGFLVGDVPPRAMKHLLSQAEGAR